MTIPGWFPAGNRRTLSKLIDMFDVESVAEVGVFVGLATVWFAGRVALVTAVDTFDAAVSCARYLRGDEVTAAADQYGMFMRNVAPYPNVTVVVGRSTDVAGTVTADLVYLDADHTYQEVAADIAAWTPQAGKVICGDDYSRNWPGVRRAVDELGATVHKDGRVWWMAT